MLAGFLIGALARSGSSFINCSAGVHSARIDSLYDE
jgi:hypothetical protein